MAGWEQSTALEPVGRSNLAVFTTPTAALVDLQDLGWNELPSSEQALRIGATCTFTFARLLRQDWPGIHALGDGSLTSFEVAHLATGGNLCLALTVAVMALLLVALETTYTGDSVMPSKGSEKPNS